MRGAARTVWTSIPGRIVVMVHACARRFITVLHVSQSALRLPAPNSRAMNSDPQGVWSREHCLELAANKGFAPPRAEQICATSSSMGDRK